jgi:hypothetical protein
MKPVHDFEPDPVTAAVIGWRRRMKPDMSGTM